ncbi:MAG: hypothetical protein SOY32_00500 [Candidatus Faecousia sp.]|nr:hypothetical protein [Clostridiales bacterium]MDD7652528.1 hypothetical protein [Bacillota bacterium]MDY4218884.1 hypothetical protein [Candidatus Faecousia sp.]
MIHISPWLPVILCLFYRLDPLGCFWPFLLAAALHELGHALSVLLCGGKIRELRLGPGGAVMTAARLSYRQELLCALAGPAVSLSLPLFGWPWLGFWGLVQGAYNLLPVYPLDGGRALQCALLLRLSPERTRRILRICGLVFGGALIALFLWAAWAFHLGLLAFLAPGLLLWRLCRN